MVDYHFFGVCHTCPMSEDRYLIPSLIAGAAIVFGSLYLLLPSVPAEKALSLPPNTAPVHLVTLPSPAPSSDSQCPPGHVPGYIESERTGRGVVCYVPSFSSPTTYRVSTSAHPVPGMTAEARRRTAVQTQANTSRSEVSSKAHLCAELDQRIKHLDSRARQPLSGPEQDRITKERRAARDQQFRLPCR